MVAHVPERTVFPADRSVGRPVQLQQKMPYDLNGAPAGGNAAQLEGFSGAHYLDRANHTGAQAIATVTGLQAALDAKEPTIAAGAAGQYWRWDKTWVALTALAVANVPAGGIAAITVQAALNELDTEKLAAASYTAADVLAKLLTVDGSTSTLDADLLDGHDATYFIAASEKAAVSGVATLDSGGKIPSSQLPAIAITTPVVVASQAAQLALTAQEGDVAIRSDLNKSYIHNGGTAGSMADWFELLTPTDSVLSVNGMTGAVTVSTITGNAGTATTLLTARNFSITGGGITAAAVSFNGSAAVALSASVDAGHITLARMANLAANSFIGNNTGSAAVPLALTVAQSKSLLAIAYADVSGLASMAQQAATSVAITGGSAGLGSNAAAGASLHVRAVFGTNTWIDKSTATLGRFRLGVGDGSGGSVADENYIVSLNTSLHIWGGAAGATNVAELGIGGGVNSKFYGSVTASNGFIMEDAFDAVGLWTIYHYAGDIYFYDGAVNRYQFTPTTVLMGGTQVLTTRRTGWTAATGTAQRGTFATDTVTLINLARAVMAMQADLITHGLIGT